MDDIVKPTRAKEFGTSYDRFAPIGQMTIAFSMGIATVEDAPGLTVLDMRTEDGTVMNAAIAVYDPEPGLGHGYLVQMSAEGARSLAASLLRVADLIGPPHLNG